MKAWISKWRVILTGLILFLLINLSCSSFVFQEAQRNPSDNLQLINRFKNCEIYSPYLYHDELFFIQTMNKPRKTHPDGRIVQLDLQSGQVTLTSPSKEGLSDLTLINSDKIIASGYRGKIKYTVNTHDLSIIKQGTTEGEYSSFLLRFDQQYIFQDTYATGMIYQLLSYDEQLNLNWSYRAGREKTARTFLYPNFHQKDNFFHMLHYDEGTIYHLVLDLNTGKEMIKEKLLVKDDYATPPRHPEPYEEIIWGENQSFLIHSVQNELMISAFMWDKHHLVLSDQFKYQLPENTYPYSRIVFNGLKKQGNHLIIPVQLGEQKTGREFGNSYYEWYESRLLVYDIQFHHVISDFSIPNYQYKGFLLGDNQSLTDQNRIFLFIDSDETVISDYIPQNGSKYRDIRKMICLDYLTKQELWNKEFDSLHDVLFQESRFWICPSMFSNEDINDEGIPTVEVYDTNAQLIFQTNLKKPFASYRKQRSKDRYFEIKVVPLNQEKALIFCQGYIYLWKPVSTSITGTPPSKPQLVKFSAQSNGNSINRSELLIDQDWIYYTHYNHNKRVYRVRTDKTEKSLINRSPMQNHLFIMDSRIQFFDYTDWSIMDKDGSNQSLFPKLQYNGLPLETVPVNVIPYGEWIFFRGFPERLGDNEISNLYKMNKDRSDITLLYQGGTDYLNVTPHALFFVELPSNHIVTCQLDGSNIKKLNQEASKNLISDGEWVYYLNEDDNDTLYRIRSDGSQRVQITTDTISCYNVLNECIYYSNHNDNDSLYRIKSDGTERTKICEGKTNHIYVYGDWIYYLNEEDYYQFFKLSLDGTINEPIADQD